MPCMTMRTPLALLTVLALSAQAAAAQTVDELVAMNLKAKGGVEQLKAIRAMRITGRVVPKPGIEIPMTITTERPNKLRQESTLQGQTLIVAFDGETGWTINPLLGATEPKTIQGPEFDKLKTQADMDGPLVDYKEKGTTIELLGTEQVGEVKAHKLKITRKDGQSQLLFLDPATGLEIKAINDIVQGGKTMTVESYFSNYKSVGPITVAHTIVQKLMGQEVTVTVDKVEILDDVDDAVFKTPPAK
jgi:outer membrane lipoprotein-sorting protein